MPDFSNTDLLEAAMAEHTNRVSGRAGSYLRGELGEQNDHGEEGAYDRHAAAIETIAEEIGRPVHEVAAVYEQILHKMESTATVPDFLMVLVAKKVRERYRTRQVM
jgi:hypothetical protein